MSAPCPLCRQKFETFAGKNGAARHVYDEHKRTPQEIHALFMDAEHNGVGVSVDLGLDRDLSALDLSVGELCLLIRNCLASSIGFEWYARDEWFKWADWRAVEWAQQIKKERQ